MKSGLASLLALLLFHQVVMAQSAATTDFAGMAKALGIGTKVDVTVLGGSHIRGRISFIDPDVMTVDVGRPSASTRRTIPFKNVVSLKGRPASHTPIAAWIAVGAIATAVVIAISVLLIERHNERG
jgi:hypothetical protein